MSGYRIRRKHAPYWLVLLAALFIAVGQHFGWFNQAQKTVVQNEPGLYHISRFVDGDTIVVSMNGKDETLRFIGVDTPETHKPNTPVQCYGPAAAAFTKNTIGSQSVRLQADPESSNRDRYNRLLRYIYLPDGTLLNKKIIQEGFGFYYPYFPFTKSNEFDDAQKQAQAANKGLWGNCHPTPTDKGGYVSNPEGS
jgi:endonuclease YncB( thermonuclease family)